MYRTAFFLFGVLLISCTFASAAEPSSNYEHLKPLEWLIGEWCGEFNMPYDLKPLKEGDHVQYCATFRWVLNKSFIVVDGSMLKDGLRVPDSHEIIGWDSGKKKITHSIWGDYGIGIGEWSDAGTAPRLRWTTGENENRTEATACFEKKDADTYTWQTKEIALGGKKMADWPLVTFHRKTGVAADDLWNAWRQACEGTWIGEGTNGRDSTELGISKDDKFTYRRIQKPASQGACMVGEGDFKLVGKDASASVRLFDYWDPDASQVRSIASWTNGLVEEITIQKHLGTAFVGTYVVKAPGVAVERAGIRLNFPDPDSAVVKFIDGPRKGEVLCSWKREKERG